MNDTNKTLVFSGHMIDRPDREKPRFPPSKENIVAQKLASQLQAWNIGKDDLAICGGACGGDILFAEACINLGAAVKLYIPLPETEFIDRSVYIANTDWEKRYHKLSNHPQVSKEYLQDYQEKLPDEEKLPKDISVFARNNLWIIDTAKKITSSGNLYALLVWDEKPVGDGPGGTSDFAHKIQESGGHIAIINPTKL